MKEIRCQRTGAFTLIEILVALTIFGLVLAAIYSSWLAILRASKTGQEAAAQAQRERIAVRTVEEALTSARSFAADVQHYTFIGENGEKPTLSFVARLTPTFPRNGRFGILDVRRVTFSVEPGPNNELDLMLRQNPILMDLDEDEKGHPVVLARNVRGFALEFWDALSGEWMDEWQQTNQLPKLVKFTLSMGGTDRFASRIQSEITRIVSLPAIMVPPNWQVPNLQGPGSGRPGAPTAPIPIPPGGGRGVPPGLQPGMPMQPQ